MVPRLPVHTAWRKPMRQVALRAEHFCDIPCVGAVAWRELDICAVGRVPCRAIPPVAAWEEEPQALGHCRGRPGVADNARDRRHALHVLPRDGWLGSFQGSVAWHAAAEHLPGHQPAGHP